jgi:hypothetical protein
MKWSIAILTMLIAASAGASDFAIDTIPGKPRLIEEDTGMKTHTSALIAMHDVYLANGGCAQRVGKIRVEGLQFSKSGATLESFWFIDKNGSQWSTPTNIAELSDNVTRSKAGSFIKVGKEYWVHIQVCGSGGYSDLISMYEADVPF